ncbi:LysR family transcriptional regulator [Martelella alba]|uniref:LysR family transcriptional regulator n=1 Tax=Martelella alba TaxID=2590451 RepID=A0A506UAI4_9HYPH|nr:LysR family transcriptional regulator [Martelella alba]TPW30111.1 LysR family transcriptional regulator [Martelella alba]
MPNNRILPPLDGLFTFLAVSRAGGFRAAANRLGVSPSTVSETIARLETELGVPLIIRTTRSINLTEAGRVLAARLEPVIAETRSAIAEATSMDGVVRGRLKLQVPGAVMKDILPPLIDGFLKKNPEVQIEIIVDDQLTDMVTKGCDAGIRYGEHLAQDMIAIPIGPRRQWGALAASPAYLERQGTPANPRAVLDHDCIRLRFASGALTEWEFEKDGETIAIDPPGRMIIGTTGWLGALHLAIAGHGLIMTFRNWLEPHFESGQLVPVLEDWWVPFEGPFLYYSSRLTPRPLRAFIDHITAERKAVPE